MYKIQFRLTTTTASEEMHSNFFEKLKFRNSKSLIVVELLGGRRVGTRWRLWLRHCNINRKVAGSIPDGVDSVPNRNDYEDYLLGGKHGLCIVLTTSPPSFVDYKNFGSLKFVKS